MLRSIVRRTPELQVKLRNLVKSERVVLFMKGTPEAPQCGFSRKVIQAMHSIHFDDFTYVDVIKSEAVREAVKEYSEWPTIPQILGDNTALHTVDTRGNVTKSGRILLMSRCLSD
eukprot:GEMP01074018.1.p1 GENE.GEMP01074018.1~~GEMP01074018.1.p1  ORF type:complete len:122 (+),score=5.27 GEMP01074018.1:23-367(+)